MKKFYLLNALVILFSASSIYAQDTVQDCKKCIVITEQQAPRIAIINPDTRQIIWEWRPAASDLPSAHVKWFSNVDEAKPVYGRRYVLVTASGGGVALIRVADRKTVFHAYAGGNTHSAALLPDGNIVTASSTGNYLTLFHVDTTVAAEQVWRKRVFIASGHNVVWDNHRKVLWSADMTTIKSFRYNSDCQHPDLVLIDSIPVSGREGHDLFPVYGKDQLWFTNTAGAYVFDPATKSITPATFNQPDIKSVSSGPAGFPVILTKPKEQWWTDAIIDSNGHTIFEQPGLKIYKARWWLPDVFNDPERVDFQQQPKLSTQKAPGKSTVRVELPNGWSLTPAGTSVPLSSDLPLNMAFSPDGNYVAVTNNGNGKHTIDLIQLKERKLVQRVDVGSAWLGLCFAKTTPYLYVSGGNNNKITRFILRNGKLTVTDTLALGNPWPKDKIGPAGMTIANQQQRLYVVTKEDNSLYICDAQAMKVLKRVPLSAEAYTCILNPVLPELYISAWGGRKIWTYNTKLGQLTDSVAVEDHPNDMAVSHNGKWLYVANANSNSVSVISCSSRKVVETLNAALYPDAPIGATTNSVALSPDNKTLYVANADNNCLAVFDVSAPGQGKAKGYIPTGWYPTCVKVSGKQILVTNGKGMSSLPNPDGEDPYGGKQEAFYKRSDTTKPMQYIGSMFHGTLSMIPVPGEALLKRYARQVYLNTPYNKAKEIVAQGESGNPVPTRQGEASPIKYVFYVLKENRTYDQILGDMPGGNGDSSRCIFGRKVTPNAHALAEDFVLLDNFYVDAEVSADGHNWSMAGYATDFVEKNWPANYSGRGGNYDFDGSRPAANPTRGFIWDYCHRAGISFRNYGEFMDNGVPTLPVLKDPRNYCHGYPGWNLSIQDVAREQIFEHDFDSLVSINAVPRFNTVYLPNDHTSGLSKGSYTPMAHVADNDLALGRLVEHISHSPIWKESAIFVLEDDAQDGPDHVDAHRSVAYVISPYIRRKQVNHTMYSTAAMLRTMELILGLPPMSQYDAAAMPMWSCFQATPDTTAFTARPAQIDINIRNTAWNESAIRSAQFDFSKADGVPDRPLNEVIWKSVKGEHSTMPAPCRAAFVKIQEGDDDDD
ncbi:DUF6528 family protein [Chitinophaga sp. 212800010-3]|uniref:DUF6528 family protein n=1 Tax=unclassified Chitinophaga TaxID=2619133 RepID=UPI002DE5392F|nr:hypothetical protein [Chitinophaga sp. 212800010-3]